MCGIVGYLGTRPVIPILLDSLKKLEYRGYDSSGLALMHEEATQFDILKAVGKLENLTTLVESRKGDLRPYLQESPEEVLRQVGIGHIRWATHGAPTERNAHPHMGTSGRVVLVHNGIIENYAELKQWVLEKRPETVFNSETDTEVVVQLLETVCELMPDASFERVIQQVLGMLTGAYALTILNKSQPDRLYVARQQAPLLIGVLEPPGEYLVASDTVAVAQHTNRVIFLENGQYGVLSNHGVQIRTLDGIAIKPVVEQIQTGPLMVEKGGYKHFMLKEIHEQPNVVRQSLQGRLNDAHQPVALLDSGAATPQQQQQLAELLQTVDRIVILGCGSSFHAGLVGKYFLETLCQIPVEVESAGEFRYRTPVINEKTLVLAISQSGETADTLEAVRIVNRYGATTIAITNREESSITRESRFTLPVRAGVEVSVCATKSFIAQVVVLYLIGLAMAEARLQNSPEVAQAITRLKQEFLQIPVLMESILANAEAMKALAKTYGNYRDMLFIARGVNFPVALEGALKLKEISYLHAEGYSGSELKHGPIALLDKDMPVVSILSDGVVFEKMISNCQEARARDAKMIAITNIAEHPAYPGVFDHVVLVPKTSDALSPLLMILPLQLLSYYIAEYLGKDVDQPRNLAKSVTVE